MNRKLQEKRTLVELARRFGQEPSPGLLEELALLERDEEQRLQREHALRERIATDLNNMFGKAEINELVQPSPEPAAATPAALPVTLTETPTDQQLEITAPTPRLQDAVADYIKRNVRESTVVNPEPVLAQPQRDLEREVKYLKEWVSRIAATGPGGGEVNFRYLDDIDRSSIATGKFLTYEPSTRLFTFETVPVGQTVNATTAVTTGSYTISTQDYYVGVNTSTSVTISMPVSTTSGRTIIIKDESGRCSKNKITIAGTIDNDTSGAILAIDNGALHLIYRQGWRIV
jgi:hypothetical protein